MVVSYGEILKREEEEDTRKKPNLCHLKEGGRCMFRPVFTINASYNLTDYGFATRGQPVGYMG